MRLTRLCILLSSLLALASARHRLARESGDTVAAPAESASSVEPEPSTTPAATPAKPVEQSTEAQTEQQIKDENIAKCQKCLKRTFQFGHKDFCAKCVEQKVIDLKEAEDLSNAMECKKCEKAKYKSRHEDFCSTSCIKPVEEPVKAEEPASTTTTTEEPKVEDSKKANKDRKKNKKNDKSSSTATEETPVPVTEASTSHDHPDSALGLLGNLIKALVIQNTYVDPKPDEEE